MAIVGKAALAFVLVGLVFASTGAGDPRSYPTQHVPFAVVSFPGGHVTPNALGLAAFSATDLLVNPMGGVICQDTNANNLCGDEGELSQLFCGSAVVASTAAGGDWVTTETTWVWLDTVFVYAHGCDLASIATAGEVSHS